MKKIAFFVSSIGDTDLALQTIKSLETKGDYEILLISLTNIAKQRIANFTSSLSLAKIFLAEMLKDPDAFSENSCTKEQLNAVVSYIQANTVTQAYCGIPSVNNAIPFQIAAALEDISVLMAYEFMFKPETHCLWQYLPQLQKKSNIQWALPLADAASDFNLDTSKMHIIGHLSIDNAYTANSTLTPDLQKLKASLQVSPQQSLAFVSSTTQPVAVDTTFLECLLTKLPKHPNMQVRLGLHPGIQDLDNYLAQILAIYKKHPNAEKQFQIIIPENLVARLKKPELSIGNSLFPSVFLRVNVSGAQAALAADLVAQAVPGALLNEAILRGKPVYAHSGKPYLPKKYFASSLETFFSSSPHTPLTKHELGLDEKAPEKCAAVLG